MTTPQEAVLPGNCYLADLQLGNGLPRFESVLGDSPGGLVQLAVAVSEHQPDAASKAALPHVEVDVPRLGIGGGAGERPGVGWVCGEIQ